MQSVQQHAVVTIVESRRRCLARVGEAQLSSLQHTSSQGPLV